MFGIVWTALGLDGYSPDPKIENTPEHDDLIVIE
jgi:hypothetical protein